MRFVLSLLILASACGGSPYSSRLLKAYPQDRAQHVEAAGVSFNGKIWLISGTPGSPSNGCNCEQDATADVDIYDPATDSWSAGPKVKHPRAGYPSAYAIGDTLYYFGSSLSNPNDPMEKLAPPYTAWEDVPGSIGASSIDNRAGGVVDGKIVCLEDGFGLGDAYAQVFDPATGKWAQKAQLPQWVGGYMAGAVADGKLFILGGLDVPAQRDFLDIFSYDVAADRWSKLGQLPTAPTGKWAFEAPAVFFGAKIVMLGGDQDGDVVIELDPKTGTAQRFEAALAEPRSDHVAAVVSDKIYLLGGIRPETTDTAVATIEVRK